MFFVVQVVLVLTLQATLKTEENTRVISLELIYCLICILTITRAPWCQRGGPKTQILAS